MADVKINYNWDMTALFALTARAVNQKLSLTDIFDECRTFPQTYGDADGTGSVLGTCNPDKMRSALSQQLKSAGNKDLTASARAAGATPEQIRRAVKFCRPKRSYKDGDAITLLECVNAIRLVKNKEMQKLMGSATTGQVINIDLEIV